MKSSGAAGLQGWHKVRTLLRFTVDGGAVSGMEVVELMPRRPSAGLQKPTPTP
jgi:arginase family enzyme